VTNEQIYESLTQAKTIIFRARNQAADAFTAARLWNAHQHLDRESAWIAQRVIAQEQESWTVQV